MSLGIIIKDGQLIFPLPTKNPGEIGVDFRLCHEARQPRTGELAVAVCLFGVQLYAVPNDCVSKVEYELEGIGSISLFWATDENTGKEVLVAHDSYCDGERERAVPEMKRWFIVPKDRWVSAPFGTYLLRLFDNSTKAFRITNKRPFAIVLPSDTISNWMAIVAVRFTNYYNDCEKIIRTLGLAKKLAIRKVQLSREKELGCFFRREVIIGASQYILDYIISDFEGNVFVIASKKRGDIQRIIGRKFTQQEFELCLIVDFL